MNDKNVLLSYEGALSYDIILDLGDKIREMVERDYGIKTAKNVFACSNELLQNIYFYSQQTSTLPDGKIVGCGKMCFFRENGLLLYKTENLITNERLSFLKARIAEYNLLSKDDFNKIYKEKRLKSQAKDSKGGGLGFFEILKRSGNPIEVDEQRLDDKLSKIILQISFNTEGKND